MRRLVGAVVALGALVGLLGWWSTRPSPRSRAEAAERAGRWSEALAAYRELTNAPGTRGRDFLGEGRALLGLDRAREAEIALRRCVALDPDDVEARHALLEVHRIERRGLDALKLAEEGLRSDSRTILRDLTLALLFLDVPIDARAEAKARETLARWIAADPEDDEARAALALRMAVDPQPSDPERALRIGELSRRLNQRPESVALREALVVTLADAGEVDDGRALLDAWPASLRDVRYDRLRGRWDLEYDRRPEEAAAAFRRTLQVLPHDWRTRYRLSRSLKVLGRQAEADQEAAAVAALRERLEPSALAARLSRDLGKLDDPTSIQDLAALCRSVGLNSLADAWSRAAVNGRSGLR